jgi:hypothetical protein
MAALTDFLFYCRVLAERLAIESPQGGLKRKK